MGRLISEPLSSCVDFVDMDHRDSESECDCFSCIFFREDADVERQAYLHDDDDDQYYDVYEEETYRDEMINSDIDNHDNDNDDDGENGYDSDYSCRSFKRFLWAKMELHLDGPYKSPSTAIENSFITMNTLKNILLEYEATHPTQHLRHWDKFIRFYRQTIQDPLQELINKMKEAYDLIDACDLRHSASMPFE